MLFQDGSSQWVLVQMGVVIIITHIRWFVDVIVSELLLNDSLANWSF